MSCVILTELADDLKSGSTRIAYCAQIQNFWIFRSLILMLFIFAILAQLPAIAQDSRLEPAIQLHNQAESNTQSEAISEPELQIPENQPATKTAKELKKEIKEGKKLLGGGSKKEHESTASRQIAPCMSWIDPLVKPNICLLCIHGLGLYSGSYSSFGTYMAKHGVATYAIDVRGFGSWLKAAGDDDIDFPACLDDIQSALKSIRAANPNTPVFILGESMGGAIALRSAALYPDLIDGLISSVPAGSRFKQKKTDLKVALELLTGPNKQHNEGKAVVAQATENLQLRKDWENEPLDRMNFSAKQLIQFQKFMNENHDAARLVTNCPVLFIQGSKDKLVKPEGTWELFSEVANEDKIFFSVPSEHLIFEDQQDHSMLFDERVLHLVIGWLQTHLPAHAKWTEPVDQKDDASILVKLFNNDYIGAKKILDNLIQSNPADSRAYFLRALAESRLNQAAKARADFTKAMSFGHANDSSKRSYDYLLSILAYDTNTASASAKNAPAGTTHSVPIDDDSLNLLECKGQNAILAFYAPWAEQCAGLDKLALSIEPLLLKKNVKFVKVNTDEPRWASLIKTCNVGPIPAFVFIRQDGTFGSMAIGFNNLVNQYSVNLQQSH